MSLTIEANGLELEVESEFNKDDELTITMSNYFDDSVSMYLTRAQATALSIRLIKVLEDRQ